ncbi:Putative thiol:disulfide oxidoreductase involved in cytochrome C-type biogenesis [Methanosarcina siciliae T4/M]|uniref:Putative thiol:disulfide oxidoreductase involved in cytochrome C-type biogenesis n=1 Tax=Methanosarcina siciliae T4/M TaxID=1434120 RepID=A0A0E3P7V4_9EURY|nr:thioredoxin family protein [Methanosarcina siciliae]AKB30014.1 Putative thiol:disulfide oxidoreductase involved in cytochrome C-type biogenesis [Methanosarcina siciliae T4/M]
MKRLHKIKDKERVSSSLPFFLKKPFFILVIFCFLLFSSGCTDVDDSGNEAELVEVTEDVNNSDSEAGMVEVTNLNQIDEALTKGPVVLKLGSKGCIPCQEQEEVLAELLPMYQDSASIMLIDVKEQPEFATTFGVRVIPDTCIITGIEDGKYMYMRPDGSKSSERANARFLGVADKETLSETLEEAIESRNIVG